MPSNKPTPEDLAKILADHKTWLSNSSQGKRANLRSVDLYGADLQSADLQGADLRSADLQYAYLRSADLQGADLYGANLQGADLRSAYLQGANLPAFQVIPEEGAFIAWKKVSGAVLKVEIPAGARRTSSLVGRKCRADSLYVLEAFGCDPETVKFQSKHDTNFTYEIGKLVKAPDYDPDIRIECTKGLHFFITRAEAEAY